VELGGMAIFRAGSDVPTVGADPKLNSFRYLKEDEVFVRLIIAMFPLVVFTIEAFVPDAEIAFQYVADPAPDETTGIILTLVPTFAIFTACEIAVLALGLR
jgi:hypothetical protein